MLESSLQLVLRQILALFVDKWKFVFNVVEVHFCSVVTFFLNE
jgi:hypothetical protein